MECAFKKLKFYVSKPVLPNFPWIMLLIGNMWEIFPTIMFIKVPVIISSNPNTWRTLKSLRMINSVDFM